MKRMLFNATYQEELRVATVDGQKLVNFDIETSSKTQRRGNIYKGVITRVEPSLEACFVDYGTEKQGFLPFKEIDPSSLASHLRDRDFNKLPEGTELIVQVEKDERGNKGAALTARISLPGRYLVLMPISARAGGISRRIDGDERDSLKEAVLSLEVPDGMSIIARTAALGKVPEELQWDLNYLVKLWGAITTAAGSHSGSFLIYQESNLVVRSIRDHFSPDIAEILIDVEDIYEQAKQFISHVIPHYVDRVKLYTDDVPLFSRFQIEHQIQSAYGRTVNLPSGGAIVIDHTEALTAIDVNSAKANKGADIEATALATNLEAAEEVALQMRLRDLGGLVVIDFIDMENPRNQREVENYFKDKITQDRARIQIGKLSRFGLLELSRQRLQASLEESSTIPCPRCSGVGTIRGIESNALHILRIIQEEAVKGARLSAIHVQLPIAIATYLLNEKRDDVAKIENRMKIKIMLVPNLHLETPHYKIRKINSDGNDNLAGKSSYDLVEAPEEEISNNPGINKSAKEKSIAMVRDFAPNVPAPVVTGKSSLSKIFDKIVNIFKGDIEETPTSTLKPPHSPRGRSTNTKRASSGSGGGASATRSNNPRSRNNAPRQAAPAGLEGNTTISTATSPPSGPRTNNRPAGSNATRSGTGANSNRSNTPRTPRPTAAESNTTSATSRTATTSVAPHASTQGATATPATTNSAAIATQSASPTIKTTSPANAWTPTAPVVEVKAAPVIAPVSTPIPVKVRENSITKPVDLGELQLVATDAAIAASVANTTPVVDTQPVKRYNDIERPQEMAQAAPIEYEIVETK